MKGYKEEFLIRNNYYLNHIKSHENLNLLKHLVEALEENAKYYKKHLEKELNLLGQKR